MAALVFHSFRDEDAEPENRCGLSWAVLCSRAYPRRPRCISTWTTSSFLYCNLWHGCASTWMGFGVLGSCCPSVLNVKYGANASLSCCRHARFSMASCVSAIKDSSCSVLIPTQACPRTLRIRNCVSSAIGGISNCSLHPEARGNQSCVSSPCSMLASEMCTRASGPPE